MKKIKLKSLTPSVICQTHHFLDPTRWHATTHEISNEGEKLSREQAARMQEADILEPHTFLNRGRHRQDTIFAFS
jgi:hypothetical protein